MALQKQVVTIPLAEGLDTKTDDKQVMAGKALKLENARFYKNGKLQKRFGSVALSVATTDADITSKDISAIVSDDTLANVLTADGVYALSGSSNEWEKISDMKDMVKVKSDFVSKSAYNHFNPDMDYNPEFNLIATVYREREETDITSAVDEFITIVTEDVRSGIKKIRKIDSNSVSYKQAQQKVMVVNYNGEPRVHVFYHFDGLRLMHRAFDKNLEAIGAATTIITFGSSTELTKSKFDVCKDATNIYLVSMLETTQKLYKISLAGTIPAAVSRFTVNRLGSDHVGDNGLGLSICVTADRLHVFFISNTTTPTYDALLVGVGYNKTLVKNIDETINVGSFEKLIDLSVVTDGATIFIATSSILKNTSAQCSTQIFTTGWTAFYTFVEPLVGEEINRAVIISRPFLISGIPYVVCKCPELSQQSGFVCNLETFSIVAMFSPFGLSEDRMASQVTAACYTGTCNSVVTNNLAMTMVEKSYGANTNNVLAYDFNASVAISKLSLNFRNDLSGGTKSKIGETIYYTNGPTFSLDGRGAYESGFNINPKIVSAAKVATGTPTAAMVSKTFSYIAVYNYYNGKGEIERSIPSPAVGIVTDASTSYVRVEIKNQPGSFKNAYWDEGGSVTQKYVAEVVLFRTQNLGTTYYRVSSTPVELFGDTVSIQDAAGDSDISNNAILYTAGSVLENGSTPNAKFGWAGGNRYFLGGLEEEDEIAFSKKQLFGEAVAFSDALRIRISSGTSSDKTKLAAGGYLDGKIIVFRENSVYFIAGDGPLETGFQDTFTEPEVISSDTGCNEPRSVLNIPTGLLFKSKKGIYLLDRSFQVSYVGQEVEDFNSEKIVSALVHDKFNEARFYTEAGNCLVYNYHFGKWDVLKNQTTISADIWEGKPILVRDDKIVQETEGSFLDEAQTYSMTVKTAWLKLNGLQDYSRIWTFTILGKFKSAHTLKVKVKYDYNEDDADAEIFTFTPLISDKQYQYQGHLRQQKCESIQFEIWDENVVGESMELSAISCEVGVKQGAFKLAKERKA